MAAEKKTVFSIGKMRGSCEEVGELLKALAHPQRLLILGCLMQGEKSVGDLLSTCELSQSQASQFLVRMRREGLLQCRTEGKFRIYSIADERLRSLIQAIHGLYCVRQKAG